MHAITKLSIQFYVDEHQTAHNALQLLPGYVQASFQEHAPRCWHGDF